MGFMHSQHIVCKELEDLYPLYEATKFWELHRTRLVTYPRAPDPMLAPFLCALTLPSDITAGERSNKVGQIKQRGQIPKDELETLQGCTELSA